MKLRRFTPRKILIVVHDLLATAAAILMSFYLRFETAGLEERLTGLSLFLPVFLVYAAGVYLVFDLYKGKWRFASLPDLSNIIRSATVLALSLLVLDYVLVAPNVLGTFFFGKLTILLYWFLQVFFLGGSRLAYRWFRFTRTRQSAIASDSTSTLVIGRAADADVLLRAIESGAAKNIWPLGILSDSPADQGQSVRGVPVLGTPDDLEQVVVDAAARSRNITRIVLAHSALAPEARPEKIVMKARRLGLATNVIPSFDENREALRLKPVNVEDLLLRPSVKIDFEKLKSFIGGKSIVVTGGGGSIGSEICEQIVSFGAGRVLVLENSEPALHAVLEMLAIKRANASIEGRLADVRDRDRIIQLIGDFKPDIVFHAAALKHVPLLERNWEEGIKTNVFGSVNVADAAAAAGAAAMVMISTDKAVEPVSVLGATKRFAEMYCQALDQEFARGAKGDRGKRFIAVRFGNVLASNGSVLPKFKAQIEAGGPVTVTHPDMVRYFMTIREACNLVMTAACHSFGPPAADVAIYVLNMGQPVKIVELAERLIRLSGLEPGVDIDIKFIGMRPGERLHEILFAQGELTVPVGVEGIVAARPVSPSLDSMQRWLAALSEGLRHGDRARVFRVLHESVPDFCQPAWEGRIREAS